DVRQVRVAEKGVVEIRTSLMSPDEGGGGGVGAGCVAGGWVVGGGRVTVGCGTGAACRPRARCRTTPATTTPSRTSPRATSTCGKRLHAPRFHWRLTPRQSSAGPVAGVESACGGNDGLRRE